jgi:hypothetical protein
MMQEYDHIKTLYGKIMAQFVGENMSDVVATLALGLSAAIEDSGTDVEVVVDYLRQNHKHYRQAMN